MRIRAVALPTFVAVIVLVVALVSRNQPSPMTAGEAETPVVTQASHITVNITNYAFISSKLTVKAGTHVTWINHDATAHTATANNGAFDTGTINPNASKTIDLTKPGTYAYHCAFHAFMTATVTVVG